MKSRNYGKSENGNTSKEQYLEAGLILENKGKTVQYMCGITKNGQDSPVKGHNCGTLLHIFHNLGHLKR